MADKIEIDRLVLVERILIPMQNISLGLRFINEGKSALSAEAYELGLANVQANAEKIVQYVSALKDGVEEEPTLRLPQLIRKFTDDSILVNSFGLSAMSSDPPKHEAGIIDPNEKAIS